MPAGQGKDAEERFAASLERRRPRGFDELGDEFAREHEIVALLGAANAQFTPDPRAKARAKQRLLQAMATEAGRDLAAPSATETTLPVAGPGRLRPILDDEHITEQTTRIAPVPAFDDDAEDDDDAFADELAALLDGAAPAASADADENDDASGLGATTRRHPRRGGRHVLPGRPARAAGSVRPGRGSLVRRALVTASVAVVAIAVIAGGGVLASRDALPGDGLYGVKRAAESAGLALTFNDAARANRHLELASERLAEVEQLTSRPQTAALDPALIQSAITDFDTSTGDGSQLLLADDVANDPARLADLQAWTAEQVSRLATLRSSLPAAAQAEVDRSIAMLDQLLGRASALQDRAGCTEVTSGERDALGPLPATGQCTPRPSPAEAASASDDPTSSDVAPTSGPAGMDGTTTPGDPSSTSGTPSSAAPSERSGTPGLAPPPSAVNGVLPPVLGVPLPGSGSSSAPAQSQPSNGGSTPSTTSQQAPPPPPIAVPLPLPLLPPINLPPLLPGSPGITIG